MKQEREQYSADDILNSLEGLQRARVNEYLFREIEQKLSVRVRGRVIPLRTVSLAAASILLLLAVNIFMLTSKSQQQPDNGKDAMQQAAQYYGLTDNQYGL